MSLDNIQLTPNLVQQLFNNSLIELKTKQSPEPQLIKEPILPEKPVLSAAPNEIQEAVRIPADLPLPAAAIPMLGKFQKKVLLVLHETEAVYVKDDEMAMLLRMLNRCNLTLDDAGIINLVRFPEFGYQHITQSLKASIILLFGVSPSQVDLPMNFPKYQIQRHDQQTYLYSADLNTIHTVPQEKLILWDALQRLFGLK